MRAEPVAKGLALMPATYLMSRAFLNIVEAFKKRAAAWRAEVENILRQRKMPKM